MIECPIPALKKLADSKILDRIIETEKEWSSALLGHHFYLSEFAEVFEDAEELFKDKGRTDEYQYLYKQVLELEVKLQENNCNKHKILENHPFVLGYFILRDELFDYKQFGFNSRKQLEECITSYCLSDKEGHNEYIWISDNRKNLIDNYNHGDFFAGQTDISGRIWKETTLFGEIEQFDTKKEVDMAGMGCGFEQWQIFLGMILKYAMHLGKENMDEIVNWKDVCLEIGTSPSCSAEAFGTGEISKYHLYDPLHVKATKPDRTIAYMSNGDRTFVPVLDDGKMIFYANNGEIELPTVMGKYSPFLEYHEQDLPDLLKGTYKCFSRDRSIMPIILEKFKKGELFPSS